MIINVLSQIVGFIGSLCLLLFGMNMLSNGIQKGAGVGFKSCLEKLLGTGFMRCLLELEFLPFVNLIAMNAAITEFLQKCSRLPNANHNAVYNIVCKNS